MNYNPLILQEKTKKVFDQVSKNVSDVLLNKYGIKLKDPNAQYTITVVVLEECARVLGQEALKNSSNVMIELHHILNLGFNYDDSIEGEMSGNIVPVVQAGADFKLLVKNNDKTEADCE